MHEVGRDLSKLEDVSRVLIDSIGMPVSTGIIDAENLARVLSEKITMTKQKFNNIEVTLGI